MYSNASEAEKKSVITRLLEQANENRIRPNTSIDQLVKQEILLSGGIKENRVAIAPDSKIGRITASEIIAHNIRCFDTILKDDLLRPYQAIVDGMFATLTRKITKKSTVFKQINGKQVRMESVAIEYEEYPDHNTRRQAARAFFALTGYDPNAGKLKIELPGSGDHTNIAEIYINLMNGTPEEQETQYNIAKKAEKGNSMILPDYKP